MTVDMTLTEFLLEQIGEDEDVVRELIAYYVKQCLEEARRWHGDINKVTSPETTYLTGSDYSLSSDDYYALLTARPARVLAECAAKRAIVVAAAEATGLDLQVDQEFRVGPRDETVEPYCGDVILRALALPYSFHKNYREEWKP